MPIKMSTEKSKDKAKTHKLSLKVSEVCGYRIGKLILFRFQRGVYPAEDFSACVSLFLPGSGSVTSSH
ncbi:mitotic spindle checkpoint component mad2 protein [Rutstroemia sp. NJR-2017a BVV2]|nr:mitotic spindle checkpoint component mad2 protein [Rutstroemia sp. NJR-2017a BVV2]